MVNILHDKDADEKALEGKTVAVIGYGSQGSAQAIMMKESGVNVIVGETEKLGDNPNQSWSKAKEDGFEVMTISEASEKADIIHMLLPDEFHAPVYKEHIEQHMKAGKVLSCSHGFNIVYKQILPSKDIDVIMVAPKAPATEELKAYKAGFGVPGLVAVQQDASGKAKDIALAMAKSMRFTKAGVLECTFEQETYEDLFGEQNVLCGGCVDIVKYGFEVLVEAGYPPEMAYFECMHELKLIVDLMFEGGIQKMNAVISNTAEFGEYYNGPKIIDPSVKERMKESLKRIEDGTFAKDWLEESRKGAPNLLAKRKALGEHPIEIVGKRIREMFEKK
ncbi:MAG: ketol-acid reductoisomerase [Candidatus Woesearchaeota archaeon]|jgi:ketol-acid reductoisomerase|nr:ketol-acid reductoisomerase [Candidatus Woesearchaeota archaeon]MDP7457381.1 ketol-acid reductoisomerase [Candidatus Woesearchaeota archaeon]